MNGIVHYTSNQNEDEIPEYLDFKYYVKLYLENNENKINQNNDNQNELRKLKLQQMS